MNAFPYERVGGPAPIDDTAALEFARALRLHDARWQVIPRTIIVTSPAAGADFTVPVPGGVTWLLLSLSATLVTSAVVANRTPVLTLTDGSTTSVRVPLAAVVAASSTAKASWIRNYGDKNVAAPSAAIVQGFPGFPLASNYQLAMSTQNLDVGDQWSAIALLVIQLRERTMQEMARYAADLDAGAHDELFPGFPIGL